MPWKLAVKCTLLATTFPLKDRLPIPLTAPYPVDVTTRLLGVALRDQPDWLVTVRVWAELEKARITAYGPPLGKLYLPAATALVLPTLPMVMTAVSEEGAQEAGPL